MDRWRLLDTPPMTAAENMALDETLVELKGKGRTPNTIHFLQFSPRAVLLGFHQSIREEIRTEYCAAHGIDINRRVTGGGAIFFDESQLGWEVICDKDFFQTRVPTQRLFRTLCDPVITALDLLGVKSSFRPRNDIEINGRKISGTGGTESDGAFLFQGTMLTDFDVDTMLKSLRIPVEKLKAKEIDSVKERVTCLKWELGKTPSLHRIKKAIKTGFEKHLGIRLESGGLSPDEERLFHDKVAYFQSSQWVDMVRPVSRRSEVVQAAYKNEEGLVRFTFVIDLPRKRIKDVFITGDILSFPGRALFDLESALRGTPMEMDSLSRVINGFFADGLIRVPGMTAEDFLKPVEQAVRKVEIAKYGIPLEYCNLISVANGTFEEVLKRRPSVLLLPYCSKDLQCELRYRKGCRVCGECSIGPAWTMGRMKDMKVVCVVSFEDLMGELKKMKADGISAYIGCCCRPFFTKHVDDFERVGVPGILLDIDDTTCYELDQAREAYAGRFSSQTRVNLDLLDAVMNTRVA